MPSRRREDMSAAVALITSVLGGDKEPVTRAIASDLIGGDPDRGADMLLACANVAVTLLVQEAAASGADPDEALRNAARIIASGA